MNHVRPVDVQARRDSQVNFTEASRGITYVLWIFRGMQNCQWTSWKHQDESLTGCGFVGKVRRSGGLHGSIEKDHILSMDVQARGDGQLDFTEPSRGITYHLWMCG